MAKQTPTGLGHDLTSAQLEEIGRQNKAATQLFVQAERDDAALLLEGIKKGIALRGSPPTPANPTPKHQSASTPAAIPPAATISRPVSAPAPRSEYPTQLQATAGNPPTQRPREQH